MMSAVSIRQVLPADLDRCAAIEAACYGPEGATHERIEHRIVTYPQGFLVADLEGRVVGFVNSGATDKDDINDEAFKDLIGHTPTGKNLVIFSLAVQPDFQRQNIGWALMEAFIETAIQLKKNSILLLCQPALLRIFSISAFAIAVCRHQRMAAFDGMRWSCRWLTSKRAGRSIGHGTVSLSRYLAGG